VKCASMTSGAVRILAVLSIALGASCAAPPATGDLQPGDFAYGQSVNAPAGAPFVRVVVPDQVFTQTAWPDLRDVRVFNASGEAVPFARMTLAPSSAAARTIALRSFRLDQMNPGGLPRVELDAGSSGVQMRVTPGATPEGRAEYLLATSEDDAQARIDRLLLSWGDTAQSWQQKVTVSVSQDLQSWTTVAFRRPIMDLRSGAERLTHREIAIDTAVMYSPSQYWQPSSGFSGRYWRLQFDPGFAPSLTGVDAELVAESVPAPGVTLTAHPEPQPDGSMVYRLSGMQPVARVRLAPQEANSVLPVLIEARGNDSDKWQFIASTVVYRVNTTGGEQYSEPLRLDRHLIGSFRVRPFGTSWGSTPPEIVPERDALVLVVNTRGAGPFLLTWGSRAATESSVDLSLLVPGGNDAIGQLSDATMGAWQQLGGPDRLTALAPAERAARWQTAMVWVALIGGAAALAFLALRLLRETKAAA
jgi:hypothetical protein